MKILHVVDEIKPFFFIQPSAYNRHIDFRRPDFLMDIQAVQSKTTVKTADRQTSKWESR